MIIAYLIMSIMIVLSILYLYHAVVLRCDKDFDTHLQAFSNVRRTEIAEEESAGRLTRQESAQLLLDIEHEENRSHVEKTKIFHVDLFLARWLMFVVVTVVVVGSVSLYQWIGYAKDVVFTQDFQDQQLTPEKVSDFLQYSSRRYNRVEDWYYEATDYLNAGEYEYAVTAFEKALDRLPENAENRTALLVEYVQAIFYASGNKSSDKMRRVLKQILLDVPTEVTALGLKGVAEFDEGNYLAAVLAWQEAIRYNPSSTERMALLSAIGKARELGNIDDEQVPPIITHQVAVKVEWDTSNVQWHSDDILLVYALAEGQKMPVAIQKVSPNQLGQPIVLTNLDALMPTVTLAEMDKVDLVVKLSNINDNDLTKGRIIGIKESSLINNKEIIVIKVAL